MGIFRKLTHRSVPVSAKMLFRENEIETNRLTAKAMVFLAVSVFLLAGISLTESYDLGPIWCTQLVVIDAFLFLLTSFIAEKVGYEKSWLKDLLLTSTLLFSAVIYFLYPMNSAFMLFGPLLLSTRYYNGKLTARIAVETWLAYVVVMQLAVYLNPRIESLALLRQSQDISVFNYPEAVWKYYIAPRTVVQILTGVLAVILAESGRRLVIRQAEVSKKASAYETQLDLAADIQKKALPADRFETPRGEVRLDCSMSPAKEVGGDYYDYFMMDEDHLAILIADVSDKGLPAAMFMMAAQNALRSHLMTSDTVVEAFRRANLQLCSNNGGMFITVWGGVIDLKTGRLEFVNAGHIPPIYKNAQAGTTEWVENDPDLFLGVFENAEFSGHELTLEKGDCLILYTDGVTDAKNRKGQRYGTERLLEEVSKLPGNAGSLQLGIVTDVERFYRGAPQFDDITMLICERRKDTADGEAF